MNELENLLAKSDARYHYSEKVKAAFRACPRHLFVHGPYSMEEVYEDHPLALYEDEDFVSTISQPSFVLWMLDLLDLKPGQKVIELGAGSGWNAALMGHIVGEKGRVVSIDIIPKLTRETQETIKKLGIKNVDIILGDGTKGYPAEAPYDRGVFTAGATDLPLAFHEEIKVGGRLLFVLKGYIYSDLLLLLEKKQDHFEALKAIPCQFVPVKGETETRGDPSLDRIIEAREKIRIYPKNVTLSEGKSTVSRRDSVFIL